MAKCIFNKVIFLLKATLINPSGERKKRLISREERDERGNTMLLPAAGLSEAMVAAARPVTHVAAGTAPAAQPRCSVRLHSAEPGSSALGCPSGPR